ncbi:hypothetical protein EW026_g4697 [Hermanssonia centrifuga]|uniref:Protein kinase domain-containing protein n=1 Tax=Hermanssonia centrifuga TaxID=98765 RepID=A0A4S4KHC8_9APHY|nr:hypothetical protein EW026_g4697 [Hermanssonia centrifuga]
MSTGGLPMSSHKTDVVHPYVREDLAETKYIPLYAWTQAVLGLSGKDIEDRAAHIRRLRWFEDPVIRDALIAFCSTPPDTRREVGRYQPFADIANRAFELAKGNLPDIPESYPIHDICVVRNDPQNIRRIAQHELGADRSPDLLFIRGADKWKLEGSKPKRVRWVDIMAWLEFKASFKDLMGAFNRESKEYGLHTIDEETLQSRDTTPDITPLRPSATTEPTGSKRSMCSTESIDQTRGNDSGSSAKRKSLGYSLSNEWVDAKVQSGGHALETAACTYGTRYSCLGIVFDNDIMSPWYYDAAGYVSVNQSVSLLSDFPKVMAILVGFACLGHEKWGAIPPAILPPASAPYPTHFPPESLKDHSFHLIHPTSTQKVGVTLTKSLFTQYNLVGRRTFLYDIETNTVISKDPLVVKLSYQVVSRKAEHAVLAIAKEAEVEHLPEVHMWGDLWAMSDGIRQIFYDVSSEMSEDKEGPEVATYEDRTLRALVYTKYRPLKELFSKSCDLVLVMVDQMLDCLHDLRYKAKILHRDISCNNIMYEIRDGREYFILIDYDLAIVVTDDGELSTVASSKHRTGTLPFMAFELLQEMRDPGYGSKAPRIRHRLRHDLESMLYVSLWSSTSMPDTEDKKLRKEIVEYLTKWEKESIASVADVKSALIMEPVMIDSVPFPLTSEFLRPAFKNWVTLLREARIQWSTHCRRIESGRSTRSYDMETLNGMITRDTIRKAINTGFIPGDSSDDEELPAAVARPRYRLRNPKTSDNVGEDKTLFGGPSTMDRTRREKPKNIVASQEKDMPAYVEADAEPADERSVDKIPNQTTAKKARGRTNKDVQPPLLKKVPRSPKVAAAKAASGKRTETTRKTTVIKKVKGREEDGEGNTQ